MHTYCWTSTVGLTCRLTLQAWKESGWHTCSPAALRSLTSSRNAFYCRKTQTGRARGCETWTQAMVECLCLKYSAKQKRGWVRWSLSGAGWSSCSPRVVGWGQSSLSLFWEKKLPLYLWLSIARFLDERWMGFHSWIVFHRKFWSHIGQIRKTLLPKQLG